MSPSTGPIGGVDDVVSVTLAGQEVVIAESYHVRAGLFAQPMSFTIRLGWGNVARTLLAKYPPGTVFGLSIGNRKQYVGAIDAVTATDDPGATELRFTGRDTLAPLLDAHVTAEKNFIDSTYGDLVRAALDDAGLNKVTIVQNGNDSRQARTGVPITVTGPAPTVDEILSDQVRTGVVHVEIKAKLGESWMTFVRRYLDRAGLVLWATKNIGEVCISAPQVKQQPVYSIVRGRKDLSTVQTSNTVTVERAELTDDRTHRHSSAIIYGRGGGKAFGRTKAKGVAVDAEMTAAKYNQPIVHRDANVQTQAQAEALAARVLADERRSGYRLTYTVTGHTVPALGGKGRAVWTYDTIVNVQDDEFGISEPFYIESVEYKRDASSGTSTVLHLCRPQDIVLLDASDSEPA